jgi:hypothetical protein
VSPRQFLRCLPFAAIFLAAACSESLDSSANCPTLCSDNRAVFKDTTFDIVQFDTTFQGFTGVGERWPAPGLPTSSGNGFLYETYLPLISRPDSVDVRQVLRFDTLPNTLSATDTTPITAVTGSRLLLVVDTSRSSIPAAPTTVALYDLDDSAVADDTTPSLLAARFTPARLIAQRTFTRAEIIADTINGSGSVATIRAFTIGIPDSTMLRYIRARRLRIGLQISSAGSASLSIVAPSVNAAVLVPRLQYDPSPDTAIVPWGVATRYATVAVDAPERLRAQSLLLRDLTPTATEGSLLAGGLIGARSLMRVRIPRAFLDTVNVVRASLDLTQRPQRGVPGARDGVRMRLRLGIGGPALGVDQRRLVEFLDPTLEGPPLQSLLVTAADSGVRSFDVGRALAVWQAQDSTLATNFILYGEGETFQAQRPAFYSRRNANPAVRPRLRVTYTLRREGAIQ